MKKTLPIIELLKEIDATKKTLSFTIKDGEIDNPVYEGKQYEVLAMTMHYALLHFSTIREDIEKDFRQNISTQSGGYIPNYQECYNALSILTNYFAMASKNQII